MTEKELQKKYAITKSLLNEMFDQDGYVRNEEFVAMVKVFKKSLDDIRITVSKIEEKNDDTTERKINDVVFEMKSIIDKNLKSTNAEHMKHREKMRALSGEIQEKIKELGIDSIENRHNEIEIEVNQTTAGVDSIKSEIKEIKENINNIKEDINDILKKLDDSLVEIKKEITKKVSTSGGGTRRVFQPHIDRFTHLTDGVTKTFYLSRAPLKTDTIEVLGTDFPIILDPTVDFTVVDKVLTLSANIPAPSQGATLIIKYYA